MFKGQFLNTRVQVSTVFEFLIVTLILGNSDSSPFDVKEISVEMVNVYRLHFSTGDKIIISLEPSINISLDEVTVFCMLVGLSSILLNNLHVLFVSCPIAHLDYSFRVDSLISGLHQIRCGF